MHVWIRILPHGVCCRGSPAGSLGTYLACVSAGDGDRVSMRIARFIVTLIALESASIGAAPMPSRRGAPTVALHSAARVDAGRTRCGDVLSFQVLLDRRGFSPGEIDGTMGNNLSRALAAFQGTRDLRMTGRPDCDTWHALGGETMEPPLTTYDVTAEDVKGPFEKRIPPDLVDQAALAQLGYRSELERLAERFHVSPALLQRLNPRLAITEGRKVRVPAIVPFNADTKPPFEAAARGTTVIVSREDSSLRVTRAGGELMFFAPVSIGGKNDRLPLGDWKVTGASWLPVFYYSPDLFWDAKPEDSKAAIKPGPNNPVGVVWIGLNREHYGLHGTPEPGRIGQAESHGCVRLTNWDAARLASMVQPGTHVIFR
jgi:lipoprotein-anchoring transpeptidase ErfK/SrfK